MTGVRLADGATVAAKVVVCNRWALSCRACWAAMHGWCQWVAMGPFLQQEHVGTGPGSAGQCNAWPPQTTLQPLVRRDLPAAYELLMGRSSQGASPGASPGASGSSGSSGSPAVQGYARQRHEELGRLQYSAGVISYNWCLSRRLEALAHHNVFLSGRAVGWGGPGALCSCMFALHGSCEQAWECTQIALGLGAAARTAPCRPAAGWFEGPRKLDEPQKRLQQATHCSRCPPRPQETTGSRGPQPPAPPRCSGDPTFTSTPPPAPTPPLRPRAAIPSWSCCRWPACSRCRVGILFGYQFWMLLLLAGEPAVLLP